MSLNQAWNELETALDANLDPVWQQWRNSAQQAQEREARIREILGNNNFRRIRVAPPSRWATSNGGSHHVHDFSRHNLAGSSLPMVYCDNTIRLLMKNELGDKETEIVFANYEDKYSGQNMLHLEQHTVKQLIYCLHVPKNSINMTANCFYRSWKYAESSIRAMETEMRLPTLPIEIIRYIHTFVDPCDRCKICYEIYTNNKQKECSKCLCQMNRCPKCKDPYKIYNCGVQGRITWIYSESGEPDLARRRTLITECSCPTKRKFIHTS